MTRSGKKPRLWFAILTLLTFVGWAPTDFVKHGTTHRRCAIRLAAAGETWWCRRGGINGKLKDCFEENMQTDAVPLLKDYDTYQASLPVRELRNGSLLTLYHLPFYARITDLNRFAGRMSSELEMRTSVDYIAAASHSGKSASVVVGFLRSGELDDARLNFTHYLYMPFANNGGNYHGEVDEAELESACGKSMKLRKALGAAYMRECFRQATEGAYLKNWQCPSDIPDFEDVKKLLKKDVSTFMQRSPNGVLLVHVDEHRSMCPDPDFRRGAMRVLAELPGVQVLATYTDIPPLPKQKSSETCRRPIACLLPDVETIMKERLAMDDMDMGNEAILLRVATLRVTLGLALQKLLLAGLHVQSSEIDRLLHKLNNMLGNAGDNVEARLAKCITHCNRMWMEEMAEQVTSLVDLLCGIKESDSRVQEKRFPQVVALDDILTAPLEVLLRDRDEDQLSPANKLHRSGQRIFKQALKTSPRAAVTAGKILEYAYLWVLACSSCKFSQLEFGELEAGFQCQDIQPGYIFQKNSKTIDFVKVAEMQNATLYYAEGNHPCADIFFKDDSGTLYLVDVGGTSNMSKALNKVRKMNDVLVKEGSREGLQVRVVVLLPNIESISPEDVGSSSEAITVRGARARRLLGGLAQLLAWLPAV